MKRATIPAETNASTEWEKTGRPPSGARILSSTAPRMREPRPPARRMAALALMRDSRRHEFVHDRARRGRRIGRLQDRPADHDERGSRARGLGRRHHALLFIGIGAGRSHPWRDEQGLRPEFAAQHGKLEWRTDETADAGIAREFS